MNEQEFKERTKQFALKVIQLVERLPRTRTADVLGKQLLRAATSVGSNYRAACRGKSKADVIAKLGIVEEEADEAGYWMELLREAKVISTTTQLTELSRLMAEASELVAMTVASIKTLRRSTSVVSP